MFKCISFSHAQRDIFPVEIETDISRGIFRFDIIGLGDKAVVESKLRVLSAIKNSGFKTPNKANQKVTVLLSPAHKKKEGSHFDLAIALSYLMNCKLDDNNFFIGQDTVVLGELSLRGLVRPIKNIVEYIYKAQNLGYTHFIIPKDCRDEIKESGIVIGISKIVFVSKLSEAIDHIKSDFNFSEQFGEKFYEISTKELIKSSVSFDIDLIRGQEHAKRALEICLAGKHHMIISGPPGAGKTFLAKSAEQLIPPRNQTDKIERSISGKKNNEALLVAPHHTSSYTELIGNEGCVGKIVEADGGILLFDEWSEFDRRALESMRQPLEDGEIRGTVTDFILIATTNPCPCGYFETKQSKCVCKPHRLLTYQNKTSGPLLDRLELFINLDERYESEMKIVKEYIPSKTGIQILNSVIQVRDIQQKRLEHILKSEIDINKNSISSKSINSIVKLKLNKKTARLRLAQFILKEIVNQQSSTKSDSTYETYKNIADQYHLNMRKRDSLLHIARTIADIEKSDLIKPEHIIEATTYRNKKT